MTGKWGFVFGAGLVAALLGLWLFPAGCASSTEVTDLSAALDRDIAAWASLERARPLLYGEAVPGDALGFYQKALVALGQPPRRNGDTLTELGQSRDQIVADEVFDLISEGARAETIVPAAGWDGRPLVCEADLRLFRDVLGSQLSSEAVWGWNTRLEARRADPPSDGPDLMFHVERMLAFLRMTDDLSLAAPGACRSCLSDQALVAVSGGMKILGPGLLTVEEAETLARGFETWLGSRPEPEAYLQELDLRTQCGFRAALADEWPVENYRWGDAAAGLVGTRGRIIDGWRGWRERWSAAQPPSFPTADGADRVLKAALEHHSPDGWLGTERALRLRIEQYVLGLRAFLYMLGNGRFPDSVENVRPGIVRERPDAGRWVSGPGFFTGEWEVHWVGPEGGQTWKLAIREVE